MRLVRIDPPGTILHQAALLEMVRKAGGNTFIEIGCGGGGVARRLFERDLSGVGVDFSEAAIAEARDNLKEALAADRIRLVHGDIHEIEDGAIEQKDLGLSMMVMEHVPDDVDFIRQIARFVRPGGHVLLAVPGRRDRWSTEDETVGHLRRYDRGDLARVMKKAGLEEVEVWSVAVPTSNLLFRASDLMVRRSSEVEKAGLSQREQTETSGIREIPFKTVFPSVFRVILNRHTLWPLIVLQRLFYRTGLGLTMLGMGRVPHGAGDA